MDSWVAGKAGKKGGSQSLIGFDCLGYFMPGELSSFLALALLCGQNNIVHTIIVYTMLNVRWCFAEIHRSKTRIGGSGSIL